MNDLTKKIEELITYETNTNPDITLLKPSHASLINQIINNYGLTSQKNSSEDFPSAKMIFLGAPTGAGKDTLVRKIMADNAPEHFIVLNMDMFRHYHSEITGEYEQIPDKEYALRTNQSSYELYYIIQELILREFPGTNVIVTGTMRDLNWQKEIVNRYKNDSKTNYSASLVALAVPIRESAFSIFERYLSLVNTRGNSNAPLRYTDLAYHTDTVKTFSTNIHLLEEDFHKNPDRLFDSIQVYRRNKDIFDISEDTLLYDSNNPDKNKCAFAHVFEIMHSLPVIEINRITNILDIIKSHSDYLKSQGLYQSILEDLKKVLPQLSKTFNQTSK